MITKVFIISFLAFEFVITEQTKRTTVLTNRITRSVENASSDFAIDPAIAGLNVSSNPLPERSDVGGHTELPRDESNLNLVWLEPKNNLSRGRGHFVLDNTAVESLRQITDRTGGDVKEKSKGFIQFEFDIDDSRAEHSYDNIASGEPTKSVSSSLNQILLNLFPQGIADIFRFSYVAQPPRARNDSINLKDSLIVTQPSVHGISLPNPTLYQPVPSEAPSSVERNANNSSRITMEDIRHINGAVEVNKILEETVLPTAIPGVMHQQNSEISFPFGEPINVDNSSDSDYEDQTLNFDADNMVAPSEVISKQVRLELGNIHPDIPGPGLDRQINVQIIQDNLGGYGQKMRFSPTKQIDEFQEEVEKRYNQNNLRAESEAASRKFLKHFKGRNEKPTQYADEFFVQPKSIQPESLLHTYIYSSTTNSNKDAVPESGAQPSGYPSNVKEGANSKATYPERLLHTYIYSSERDRDNSGFNKSNDYPPEKQNQVFFESKRFTQTSENNEGKASKTYDGYIYPTTPYPETQYNPQTLVEIQKSLNIHNKMITEKNGNLIEQHEIYTRPAKTYARFLSLKPGELAGPVTLSERPIRVEQAGESYQSKIERPESVSPHYLQPWQQKPWQQQPWQQESRQQQPQPQELWQQEPQQQQPPQQEQPQQQQPQQQQPQQQEPQQQEPRQQEPWQQEPWQQETQQQQPQLQEPTQQEPQQEELWQQEPQQQQLMPWQQQPQLQEPWQQQQTQQQQPHQQQPQQDQQDHQQYHQLQQENYPPQQQPWQQQSDGQIYQEKYQSQNQEPLENTYQEVEKPVPGPIREEKIMRQPYPVVQVVEKYVDRPVHLDRIVEKQVNVPYPVREVVEKIVDRPFPVEKIIDRPVHIPYPVQVDHFIDRPYAVQVPVAVPVPVPVHRYIDRPYPVETIVEKPLRIPYPVEKVVEKIVEKHVPVEIERIVEKPIEKIVEKHVDRPYPVKEFINRPIPIHIPVPVGVPVAIALNKNKDRKKKTKSHKSGDTEDFFELVPPPMPSAQGYKTLPENIDYLILDEDYGPYDANHWGQPVKRGTKGHHVKRSPEFGRNFRVEYGFMPPLVPSLEIDDKGLPLASAN